MGRKIDRRTVIVNGREMIAVPPADFERLDASRRQVGAHARIAQVRAIVSDARPAECVCDRVAAALGDDGAQDSSPTDLIRSRRRS